MKHARHPFFKNLGLVLAAALVAPAVIAACGGTGSTADDETPSGGLAGKSSGKGGKGGASGKAGSGGSVAGGGGQGGTSVSITDPSVTSLVVDPPGGSLVFTNGKASPDTLSFKAKGMTAQGPIELGDKVSWSVDVGAVAVVDPTGKLTATGKQGGEVVVTATYGGLTATAKVTVQLVSVEAPADGSIPDGDKDLLKNAADPDGAASLSYPYDQTVFPLGILPPTLMWGGGAPDDSYLARLTSSFGEVQVFAKAADMRLPVPEQAWHDLLRDAKGTKVTLKLTRLSQGKATVVAQQTWPIATGPLRGTVYYWSNNLGRVLRINPGAKQPDDFLAAAGVTDGCTTCHTVSANGSTLVMGNHKAEDPNDSNAAVFDLQSNALTRSSDQGYGRRWAMPALSPDGKFAVLNDAPLPGGPGKGGGLFDVGTSQPVPGTALDGLPINMPYFSADGSALVYVDHSTGGLGAFDYNQAALPGAFSNKRDLVPQAGPAGNGAGIAFPAATPDGKWAIYHRGPLDTREGPADLYLASLQQPGVEVPLDALNGASYPFAAGDRDRHFNYEPTFAPLPAGGYFWAIFTSRRTYGNLRTGSAQDSPPGATNGTKLLWMAAIDLHPEPGKDPSHPPFLLGGQDTGTLNMRAFWVFEPCKAQGAGCQFGSDCCDGLCEAPASGGAAVCKLGGEPGTPGPCVKVGNKCETTGDCCEAKKGSECINHFCSDAKPDID